MTFLCVSSERKFQFTGSCENILQVIVNILGRFTLILLDVSNSLKKKWSSEMLKRHNQVEIYSIILKRGEKSFNIMYLYRVLPYK